MRTHTHLYKVGKDARIDSSLLAQLEQWPQVVFALLLRASVALACCAVLDCIWPRIEILCLQ